MTAPWYRRTHRWGQTNLTEVEPLRYDREQWREHWRQTAVQGLIINAGGIVAFYPSAFPLQHRAQGVADRDLLSEVVSDARDLGLSVIARMDSNRADERFYREHPDWFCVDASGEPIRAGGKYISCINSAYYDEYLPDVFREIVERVSPDGFADNSWAGLHRSEICHCDNCVHSFRTASGFSIPTAHDSADVGYRAWIEWNYARRLEVWRSNNVVTKASGGEDCLWIGMIGGDMGYNRERFVDVRAIARETPLVLLDHQRRVVREGFAQNAEVGLRVATVLGPDGRYAESMPMYQLGGPVFRLAAMPEAEARLWMTEGIAGGILPWWHHIGSKHDDRRQYTTAAPVFQWHAQHDELLVQRTPVASVGVVWSRINNDLGGGSGYRDTVAAAYRGAWQALVRDRIPFVPVHADDIGSIPAGVRTLIVPELVVMTDEQVEALRAFADGGGSIVASGEVGAFDGAGVRRPVGVLEDVLGVRFTGDQLGGTSPADDDIETYERHTYLRLEGEPVTRWEPLRRLGDTDVIGFGGRITGVEVIDGGRVPLTFVPSFPIYPPETSWMREPDSDRPALVVRDAVGGRGRVAYFAADIDRCWGRDELPDHGDLFAAVVAWADGGRTPVRVVGRGHVNVVPWQTGSGLVVHLGNVTATSRHAGRESDLIPSGALSLEVDAALVEGVTTATALVGHWTVNVSPVGGVVRVGVPPISDHEVIVFSAATE